MLALDLNFEDGSQRVFRASLPISVGRGPDCDLRLKGWRVGRYHANLEQRAAGIFIDDLGALSGTFVNGRRITQYGPIVPADEIIIGPCLIRINDAPHAEEDVADSVDRCADNLQPVSVQSSLSASTSEKTRLSGLAQEPDPIVTDGAWYPIESELNPCPARRAEHTKHCRRLHGELLEALDLRRRDIAGMSDAALRLEAFSVLAEIVERDDLMPDSFDRAQVLREVVDEAVGLGPLEPLLADRRVTEIMVNRHDEIFIESAGRLHRYPGGFSSEQAVLGVIERIVSPLGRRIDESSPMVDARLQDGSRVNAIIPPVALRGASITIRKFPLTRPRMADLLRVGALDFNISQFLTECVVQRKNMIVSGGTGSGKTTLLNILSNAIPSNERIVTIEDAAELQLGHDHLVSLEARPANLEGRGVVTIRDLVRNALRMRPDRIVVGECRGIEAFDMLAAMNTGHEGSLTTLHANNPRDALSRLETMILMAGMDLPLAAVREHVSSSIDIIVQQARLPNGQRVITSVVQVTGQESGRIQLQELFRYQPGPPGAFEGCGVLPEGIVIDGEALTIDMFNQRTEVSASAAML